MNSEDVSTQLPKPEPLTTVERLGEDELREFVRLTLANQIFTSWGMTNNEIMETFLPVALGFTADYVTKEYLEQIGIVWEYFDKAGPLAINGRPVFFSMHVMHRDDWAVALATLRREEERLRALPLENPTV